MTPAERTEYLDFHGISRSVLETRIVDLVKRLDAALAELTALAELKRSNHFFGGASGKDGEAD